MDRQTVIAVLESLANGVDPGTGAPSSPETLHSANTIRALFTAVTLLKTPGAAKSKFTAAGTIWTAEEDARLTHEFDSGMTTAQIGLKHGRTSGAITSRLVKLGRIEAGKGRPGGRGVSHA